MLEGRTLSDRMVDHRYDVMSNSKLESADDQPPEIQAALSVLSLLVSLRNKSQPGTRW